MTSWRPSPGRKPSGREGELYEILDFGGFTVTGRGWPDFTVWGSDGSFGVVEALRHAEAPLKPTQEAVLEVLATYGVPCWTWSPDGGFVPFGGTEPATPFDMQDSGGTHAG